MAVIAPVNTMTTRRLCLCRAAWGFTLSHVADAIGTSAGTVGHFEKGKSTPRLDKFMAMANLYGVDVRFLLIPEHVEATINGFRVVDTWEYTTDLSDD